MTVCERGVVVVELLIVCDRVSARQSVRQCEVLLFATE